MRSALLMLGRGCFPASGCNQTVRLALGGLRWSSRPDLTRRAACPC